MMVNKKHKEVEMERVPIAVIYKSNGKMHIDTNSAEVNVCELYGFLATYAEILRDKLYEDMMESNKNG